MTAHSLLYPMFAMVLLTFGVLLTLFRTRARFVHTYIHTGSNRLNHRIAAYFSSWAVLLALWICIVIGVA